MELTPDRRTPVAEAVIVEQVLQDALAIVEIALQSNGMHIAGAGGRHLALLHGRHAIMREQDEDIRPFTAGEGLNRRAAGVAGRRPDDGGQLAALGQDVIHQPRQQLHRNVLERERWTVKQLQHVAIRAGLHQRTHRGVPECAICPAHEPFEHIRLDFIAQKRREHANGQVRIGQAAHGPDFGGAESRPRIRHIEATVSGESGQHRVREAEGGGFPAGTHIAHEITFAGLKSGLNANCHQKVKSHRRFFDARLLYDARLNWDDDAYELVVFRETGPLFGSPGAAFGDRRLPVGRTKRRQCGHWR
jgi:hypothetical protein